MLRGEVGFGRVVAEGRRVEVREDEVDDLGAEVAEAGHGEGGELGVWRSLWDDVMELCARTMGSGNDVQSRLKWCLCWCSSRRWQTTIDVLLTTCPGFWSVGAIGCEAFGKWGFFAAVKVDGRRWVRSR